MAHPAGAGRRFRLALMAGCLRVAYSTADAQAVAAFVAAEYGLPGPLECSLVNRGFNDTFAVHAPGHGDCHGLNARIATAGPRTGGPRAGEATFFDFDDGGFGYLAYDLAVHLWAQVSFGRQRIAMWHAFIDGYRSVRPIAPADLDAVQLFVPIRHVWLMGEMAGRLDEWGSEGMSTAWLGRQVEFLGSWEADRLSDRLL